MTDEGARGGRRSIKLQEAVRTRASSAVSRSLRTARGCSPSHALGELLSAVDLKRPAKVAREVDAAGRGVHVPGVAGRQDAVRLPLGRREGPPVRRRDARAARRDRGRRAPERHGAVEGRRPPLRGLRQHERRLGGRPRGAHGAGADLDRARSGRAARHHAERASASPRTAAPCSWPTPTTTRSPSWTSRRPGASAVARLHPHRLVPHGGAVQPRRQADLRAERQGPDLGGEPARQRSRGSRGARGSTSASCCRARSPSCRCPDDEALAAVHRAPSTALTPYTAAGRLAPAGAPKGSPIPARVGGKSPIKYVFYVIRENRTYDQILGDMKAGNGDPNLCLFGEEVTPNAHALARDFVLLDNFYVNAEVSYDGHAYSTGAYATDFVEKVWPMNYAGRGGDYLVEGERRAAQRLRQRRGPPRTATSGTPPSAPGSSVRSYGEFAHKNKETGKAAGRPVAGARGAGRAGLSAVGPRDSGQPAGRLWLAGVPRVRGETDARAGTGCRGCRSSASAATTRRAPAPARRRRAR